MLEGNGEAQVSHDEEEKGKPSAKKALWCDIVDSDEEFTLDVAAAPKVAEAQAAAQNAATGNVVVEKRRPPSNTFGNDENKDSGARVEKPYVHRMQQWLGKNTSNGTKPGSFETTISLLQT